MGLEVFMPVINTSKIYHHSQDSEQKSRQQLSNKYKNYHHNRNQRAEDDLNISCRLSEKKKKND